MLFMGLRFYHNPRCSKSRQALALLEERGVEMEIVRYLDDGIVEEDLQLLASLDGIVRKKEAGADAMAALHSVDDVAALLKSNPKVLERPVLANGQAVIGDRLKTCSNSLSKQRLTQGYEHTWQRRFRRRGTRSQCPMLPRGGA